MTESGPTSGSPLRSANSQLSDGTGLISIDPWLAPYADALRHRYARYKQARETITAQSGDLARHALGHQYFGFNAGQHNGTPGVWYREWAPGAISLSLVGDFNNWDGAAHPMSRDGEGVFEIFVPNSPQGLRDGNIVKVRVTTAAGASDRIPAYIQRVLFDADGGNARGVVCLRSSYVWKHARPATTASPRIYEAHVGMSAEEGRVSTFAEFTRDMLPRIAADGYNAVQLMAVQEHPYYGSFGYHVSNFFAVSSRFGTPDDLRALIDAAHGLGIRVIIDLVHSHSVKNTVEGLSGFDGTDHQYFHAGARGQHPAWDSLLFDYGKSQVQRFLLSNVRYWLENFDIDGFRFDGVTSMMYTHHGLGQGFSSYDDYLRWNLDEDAITYLQLANELAHALYPGALCVAEDVSGMVGLCRPLHEGGIGFDYRLAMGLPDYWIKLLKETRDEDWGMGEIFTTLSNRRSGELHIAYCESHDQALVGDKTIAFWLMDKEMYWHMNKGSINPVVDRGIALHKIIRLLTFSLGGEGYLNFMGNEFGHPEWVDFPREGNGWSFHYCRRQWSLANNPELRYESLGEFDRAMQRLDSEHKLLAQEAAHTLDVNEQDKILIYRRGMLTFIVNLHPSNSRVDLRVPLWNAYKPGQHAALLLSSDARKFGGFDNVPDGVRYPVMKDAQGEHVKVYVPARTMLVLT
jgi:1,4-alpha-glucan branching enzyme